MESAILIVAAYLIGSTPTGVIVGRISGVDPRQAGSGNIGMTNVARTVGRGPAIATFAGDILKGVIPVAIAKDCGFDEQTIAVVALAAFIGAIASIFLRFKGGKGLSAGLGIWIVISPLTLMFALAAFGVAFASTRIMSVASLAAALVLPLAAALMHLPREFLVLAIAMCPLVFIRHSENIGRLIRGEEKPFHAKAVGE